MSLFCNHTWRVVRETTTKSKFEVATSALDGFASGKIKIPHQMCSAERKHIQVLACDKCGKLKRFVEVI